MWILKQLAKGPVIVQMIFNKIVDRLTAACSVYKQYSEI
jgi:hypothetical protein